VLGSVSPGIMSTGAIRHSSPRFDNVFFPSVAVLILASVFLGFARTYYLAGVFRAPLPNLLVHIHGAVFSLWILLLIAQTSFIARGRVDVHRRYNPPDVCEAAPTACAVVICVASFIGSANVLEFECHREVGSVFRRGNVVP
jgi:hypothetical protein